MQLPQQAVPSLNKKERGLDNEDLLHISSLLSAAHDRRKEERVWPVHRHAHIPYSMLIFGSWIFLIATITTASVTLILPGILYANDGNLEKRSTDSSNTSRLSWSSACWAIVAIGINTACQPFGKVLGLPYEHSFALRCAPIICFMDTFLMLLDALQHSVHARSISVGFSLTVKARFAGIRPNEDGSFGALRKNTVFRTL